MLFKMSAFVFLLLSTLLLSIGATEAVYSISFYLHAKVSTPNATAVIVAGPDGNTTGVNFGTLYVINDVLRTGQSNTSTEVGRAKGSVMVTEENLQYATYAFTVVLETDSYNGTIAFLGTDRVVKGGSELAVLGGTGDFRRVSGYANFTHVELNLPDSIIFVNATLYQEDETSNSMRYPKGGLLKRAYKSLYMTWRNLIAPGDAHIISIKDIQSACQGSAKVPCIHLWKFLKTPIGSHLLHPRRHFTS